MVRPLLLFALGASALLGDEVDNLIRAEMTKRRIPGLALAVVRDGKIVKQAGYGKANVELDVPVRDDTVFLLASLTKAFTASAVLALVDDGKIALDDPMSKHVPGLPESWAPVTIRHSLSHTSGLPDVVGGDEKIQFFTWDAALPALASRRVEPAGARSVYNQTAYALLGMLIRRISGMGFEEFIAARFLKPLEMTATTYGDQVDLVANRASMYSAFEPSEDRRGLLMGKSGPVRSSDRIFPVFGYVYPRYLFVGAGLNSTIGDLAKWEVALGSGRVMRDATLAEAGQPYRLSDGKDGEFGLGWTAGKLNGRRVMHLGGGGSVWHVRFPEDRISVIVLSNLQGSGALAIAIAAAGVYVPELRPPAR
jgi:D-alanyl-D-alanine carboxypeptidase